MNKLLTKIVGAALGVAMTVGVGVAVASQNNGVAKAEAAVTYNLLTDLTNLSVGDTVIIGATNSKSGSAVDYFIKNTVKSNNMNATTSTVTNGEATIANDILKFTVGGDSTNGWTFLTQNFEGTDGYLNSTSSTSANRLQIVASLDNYAKYDLSMSSNIITMTCKGKNSRNIVYFNYNSGSPIFNTLNTPTSGVDGYSKLKFYKQVSSGGDPAVSIDTPTVSKLPVGYIASTQLKATSSDFSSAVTYTWSATSNPTYVTLTQDPSDGSKCTVASKGTNDSGNVTIQVSATDGSTTKTDTTTITLVAVNTVAQSIAAITSGTGTQGVYTKGFVNGYYKTSTGFVTDINEAADITGSGQAKFFISDDGSAGDASSRIEAYNCLDLNKAAFSAYPLLGTEVVIYGNLSLYNSTYQIGANGYLVHRTNPTVSSIAKTSNLTTDTYTVGETFSLDGLVITATLSTGATMDVTSLCSFLPDDGDVLSEEMDELVVSYSASNNPTTTLGADLEISITISVSYPSPNDTIAAINAIGTVAYTQACWDLISAARLLYDNLPSQSQANVTNYSTLTDAEDDFEDLMIAAVSNVETLISAIGTVTLSSGTAISNAETAYAALLAGDLGKGQVSNYATLTSARTTYDALVADRAAADVVEDLIDALPAASDITDYSHHADIVAARAAYDALSAERKALVDSTKLAKLEACEAKDATFAPLEIEYSFQSGDQTGLHNLVDAQSNAVATFEAFKGGATNAPAWSSSQVRVYGGGFMRLTVNEGYIITSVEFTYASNSGGKPSVTPTAKYYAGNPGTDYANESFETSMSSGVAITGLSLEAGEEFAILSDASAGNLGYTKVTISYQKEVVTTTELRVSDSAITVAKNDTGTFNVTYYNTTSDFEIATGDASKVTVSFTSAHGAEGTVTVTVNGLAVTSSPVRLTISATGADSVYVDVTVKDIEQFKKVTTIDKLVNGAELVFSDGAFISSSLNENNRYTLVSATKKGDIIYTEGTYVKFRINLDENGYTIYDTTNEGYLCATDETTGATARTSDPTSNGTHWNISTSSGTFIIQNTYKTAIYLAKNSSNNYFANYKAGQANLQIFVKGADSITTAQSLDAFGRLYLNSGTNPVTTTPTGVDTGVCRTSGSYLRAKAALAGDWSVISSALQADQTGYGLRYASWAIANNDGAPFDGNTTVVTPLQSSNSFNFASDKSTNAAAIIAIVSVISLSAVAGFFLLRKRKEQ